MATGHISFPHFTFQHVLLFTLTVCSYKTQIFAFQCKGRCEAAIATSCWKSTEKILERNVNFLIHTLEKSQTPKFQNHIV